MLNGNLKEKRRTQSRNSNGFPLYHHQYFSLNVYLNALLPKVLPDPKMANKFLSAKTKSTSIIKHIIVPLTIIEIIKDLNALPF